MIAFVVSCVSCWSVCEYYVLWQNGYIPIQITRLSAIYCNWVTRIIMQQILPCVAGLCPVTPFIAPVGVLSGLVMTHATVIAVMPTGKKNITLPKVSPIPKTWACRTRETLLKCQKSSLSHWDLMLFKNIKYHFTFMQIIGVDLSDTLSDVWRNSHGS